MVEWQGVVAVQNSTRAQDRHWVILSCLTDRAGRTFADSLVAWRRVKGRWNLNDRQTEDATGTTRRKSRDGLEEPLESIGVMGE